MKPVILVADDSSTIRKFLSFSLKMSNFTVILAEDGMDALEKMSQTHVDLAIVDLNMPNMDGFELIENIRNSDDYGDLSVIILSSERGETSKKRGKEVSANVYVEKPFDAKTILHHVSKLLSESTHE